MVQIAAALLFALAAGLGIAVILGMLKGNGEAIASALLGEGAFPVAMGPQTGPASRVVPLRHTAGRRDAPRPLRCAAAAADRYARPPAAEPRRLTFA